MKNRIIGVFILCVLLAAGCTREVVLYDSKRPKTANMEDALILEMKQEMSENANQAANDSENATTEISETEEVTENAPVGTEEPNATEEAEATEDEDNISSYEVLLTDDVNMRSGPGDEFGILYGLTEGDVVEITGEITNDSGGDWYEITYFGESGYAYKETLDFAGQLLEQ